MSSFPTDQSQLFSSIISQIPADAVYYPYIIAVGYFFFLNEKVKTLEGVSSTASYKLVQYDTEFQVFKDKIIPRYDKIPQEPKRIIEEYIEKINRIKSDVK